MPIPGAHHLNDDEEIYTVREVAEAWNVSRMTIYRLVHSGEIYSLRIGHNFRIPERALRMYLNRHNEI